MLLVSWEYIYHQQYIYIYIYRVKSCFWNRNSLLLLFLNTSGSDLNSFFPYVSSGSTSLTKTHPNVIHLTNLSPSPLLWLCFRGNGMTLGLQPGDSPRSLPRRLVLMSSVKGRQSRGIVGRKKTHGKRQMVSKDVNVSLRWCGTPVPFGSKHTIK